MEEAEFLCHRVAIMDSGKILEIDEPKNVDHLSDPPKYLFTENKIDANLFTSLPEVKSMLITQSYSGNYLSG